MEDSIVFPCRPKFSIDYRNNQEKKKVITNLFPMKLNLSKMIYVYSISYDSSVTPENTNLKLTILRHSSKTLKEIFELCINTGNNLFSTKKIDKTIIFETALKNGDSDKKYQIEIKLTDYKIDLGKIDPLHQYASPVKCFVELILKNILHANNLMRLKNSYFDRDKYKEIEQNGYSIF